MTKEIKPLKTTSIKVSKDLHEWLKQVQASLYIKYKKSVSQIRILFHISEAETGLDHEVVADKIYKELECEARKEKQDKLPEMPEKKTNLVSSE